MAPRQSPVHRAVEARERGFRRVSAITAGLTMVTVVGTGIVAAAARAATTAARAHSTTGGPSSTGSSDSSVGTDDGGSTLQPNSVGQGDPGSQGNLGPAPAQAPPQATSGGS